jgi:type IV pilus assembly protein PilM
MEPAELRKALAFQVQDYIPIPVDEAVLDFHPIEEFTNDDGARMIRLLLVAAARTMVMSNLAAVTKAGLRPTTVDLTPFALVRTAVQATGFDLDAAATAVVDVGARVTNIVVHQAGTPRFVRILLMGGGDVTDAVATRMGVPVDDAEQVKQQLVASPADRANPAVRALDASSSALIDEIRGSLDYYRAAPGSVQISRLLLTGGSSRLAGLAQRLGEATRLPVEMATPVSSLRIGKTGLSDEQLKFIDPLAAVSIGLALGVAA